MASRLSATFTDAVADDLREDIQSGRLTPGAKLPAEAALVQRYGVSRTTVRAALTRLINEGLVTSRQGVGYYVRTITPLVWVASRPERNPHVNVSPADSWSTGVREQGREPGEKIEVSTIEPLEDVAAALDIPEGEYAVVRRRIRYVDGDPVTLADSYFPERLVRDTAITKPGDILPGTYAVLDEIGLGWVRSRDVIRPRMPTRAEVLALGLSPGTSVTDHRRTSWTADGTPIRLMHGVLPGDRAEIVYELEEYQ